MKYILAAVFLISTALAYPLADQEEIKSDVPLVITDYSSIAKQEPSVEIPAKVQQDEIIKDISHESHSTNQQDSSESNESASIESGEKTQENQQSSEVVPLKTEELEKPLLDEIPLQEQPQVSAESLPEKPLGLDETIQQVLEEAKLEEPKQEVPQLKSLEENISLIIPEDKPIETIISEKLPEPDVASNEAIPEPKVGLSEIDKVIPQESAPIPVSNPISAEIQDQLLSQEVPLIEEAPLIIPVAKKEEALLENKLEEEKQEKPLENQVEQKSLPDEPKAENSLVNDEKLPELVPAELSPKPIEEVKAALPEQPKLEVVLEGKTEPLEIVEAQVVPVAPIEENLPVKTLPEENLQVSLPAEPEKLADLPALELPALTKSEELPALTKSEELPALTKSEELPAPEKPAELPQPEIKLDAPIEKPVAIELPVQSSDESLKKTPESEEVSASVEKLPEPSPSS